ncbi:MAG: hypothetical protein GY909_14430 [Oligoflexia bacterium]|nr:hypothetical protein [Oligoflexia bacterium]
MNKFSLYTLLILIFLGLSKSFSPSSKRTDHIVNDRVFSSYFKGAPVSVVLLDRFQAGFLIKTYYFHLKIMHVFKSPETVTIRVGKKLWEKHKDNLGMSIFRREERNGKEYLTPMPPGILFVGDPSFGGWEYHASGAKQWKFHRAYRKFPTLFYWGDFRPSYKFYQRSKTYEENQQPFYGLYNEFGSKGEITKLILQSVESKEFTPPSETFLEHVKIYLSTPPWSN